MTARERGYRADLVDGLTPAAPGSRGLRSYRVCCNTFVTVATFKTYYARRHLARNDAPLCCNDASWYAFCAYHRHAATLYTYYPLLPYRTACSWLRRALTATSRWRNAFVVFVDAGSILPDCNVTRAAAYRVRSRLPLRAGVFCDLRAPPDILRQPRDIHRLVYCRRNGLRTIWARLNAAQRTVAGTLLAPWLRDKTCISLLSDAHDKQRITTRCNNVVTVASTVAVLVRDILSRSSRFCGNSATLLKRCVPFLGGAIMADNSLPTTHISCQPVKLVDIWPMAQHHNVVHSLWRNALMNVDSIK